jgi:hypothetical protein
VTYGGLEITVTDAKAMTDDSLGPGVSLTLTVRNTLAEPVKISPETIALVDKDGARMPGAGVKNTTNPDAEYGPSTPPEVTPNGKMELAVFVPVTGALDLGTAMLSAAEPEKLPASVPLAGDVPEPFTPLPITLPAEPFTVTGNNPFSVTLESGQLVEEFDGLRAPLDNHLVVIKYKAIKDATTPLARVGRHTVQLVVDGSPYDAVKSDPDQEDSALGPSATMDLTMVYELPDDHQTVSLLGASDQDTTPDVPLAITVPPLPE